MKKNRKSEKRVSKPRNQPNKQNDFRSNNHRIHDTDSEAIYDALFDEIDQYDMAISERSFMEELDRKSRNQHLRSRRRCWSPDWDQDLDDWD